MSGFGAPLQRHPPSFLWPAVVDMTLWVPVLSKVCHQTHRGLNWLCRELSEMLPHSQNPGPVGSWSPLHLRQTDLDFSVGLALL